MGKRERKEGEATDTEAREIVQKSLGRIPEITSKQILKQTGNSMRRLTKMLARLNELKAINSDRGVEELVQVAAGDLLAGRA